MQYQIIKRPRRLRYHPVVRDLIKETTLDLNSLICPVFVQYGQNKKTAISSMPGYYQISVDLLDAEIKEIVDLGIKSVILFGLPEHKNLEGSDSFAKNGIIQQAIRRIKIIAPQLLIISDVCLCQYTELGHCGYVAEKHGSFDMDNDKTLDILARQTLSHVEAGADMVAPSCMVDGMVKVMRHALDSAGHYQIPIMSYSVKYRSAMYGPFAAAADGAAKKGDRSTYQMDHANSDEAIREALLDIEEGADILMVKPAHTYLDIIYRIKREFPHIPLAAYHPSGEYCMLKTAFAAGYLEEKRTVLEVLTSIKRAGSDMIITYFTKDVARWISL